MGIRKLLYKFLKWVRDYENQVFPTDLGYGIGNSTVPDISGLRFTIMAALGGTIVQIQHYDRRKDEHNVITHVIPDGEDIAHRIGQIVSMEVLRV